MDIFGTIKRSLHDTIRNYYFSSEKKLTKNLIQLGLAPLTQLYSTARRIHQFYRASVSSSVNVPVVSVGNISIGGTGKTAFVLWLVQRMLEGGTQCGVLKRGEGNTEGLVPLNNQNYRDLAQKFGDESALYRAEFADIPIGVGKNRHRLAEELLRVHSPELLILDDGFQHRQLQRDIDVVLIDENDFVNNWQLPSGPLREPLSSLDRADFVSLKNNEWENMESEFTGKITDEVCRLSHHYSFDRITVDDRDKTEQFRKQGAILVTTLARPRQLIQFLNDNRIEIHRHKSLPDHSTPVETVRKALSNDEQVLLTRKEWIKLPETLKQSVGVIRSDFVVNNDDQLLSFVNNISSKEQSDRRELA